MKIHRFLQAFAAALLCAGGVSCSIFKKDNPDPYAADGGYNPYGGQGGQVANSYQQYQPAQQPQPSQQYAQSQPAYQDYQPQEDYTPSPSPKKKSSSSSSGGNYTVRQGDNLYRIALSHHTTVSKIKSTNGLTSDLIQPGQKLTLP